MLAGGRRLQRRAGGRMVRSGALAAAATVLAAFVSMAAWAVASAPGSSPDDDYHMASIWCARGIDEARCLSVPDDEQGRVVPHLASGMASCFARDYTVSAQCQNEMPRAGAPSVLTTHGNWEGAYPPVFYTWLSLFVIADIETSLVLMRLAAGVVGLALVGALALLLPAPRRPLATVPLMLTSVPLGMSLFASTNPSGWTIMGMALLWPALYVAFETTGRRQWALCLIAVLATVIGAGSRADGGLFALMSVALVLLMRAQRVRTALVATACAALCGAVAVALFLSSGHSDMLSGAMPGQLQAELSTTQLLVLNLLALPILWLGSFGSGPLGRTGWLDTPFPALVGATLIAVWFGVLLTAWKRMFTAKAVGLALVGAALVVHPIYLQVRTGALVGDGAQPRYLLPMVVIFTGLSLLGARGVALQLSRRAVWLVTSALALAHALALHQQIRRYVTGLDVNALSLDGDKEWWWEGMPSPTLIWVAGSLAFAFVAYRTFASLAVAAAPADVERSTESRPVSG